LAEPKVNKVIFDCLFSTITNANFDDVAFVIRIKKTLKIRDELRSKAEAAGIDSKVFSLKCRSELTDDLNIKDIRESPFAVARGFSNFIQS